MQTASSLRRPASEIESKFQSTREQGAERSLSIYISPPVTRRPFRRSPPSKTAALNWDLKAERGWWRRGELCQGPPSKPVVFARRLSINTLTRCSRLPCGLPAKRHSFIPTFPLTPTRNMGSVADLLLPGGSWGGGGGLLIVGEGGSTLYD